MFSVYEAVASFFYKTTRFIYLCMFKCSETFRTEFLILSQALVSNFRIFFADLTISMTIFGMVVSVLLFGTDCEMFIYINKLGCVSLTISQSWSKARHIGVSHIV